MARLGRVTCDRVIRRLAICPGRVSRLSEPCAVSRGSRKVKKANKDKNCKYIKIPALRNTRLDKRIFKEKKKNN